VSGVRAGPAGELLETQSLATAGTSTTTDIATAASIERGHLDAISLSLRASGLIRAGLVLRALVMNALMNVSRRLVIGGRTLILEAGIYRLAM
jgi:hypothetical protein